MKCEIILRCEAAQKSLFLWTFFSPIASEWRPFWAVFKYTKKNLKRMDKAFFFINNSNTRPMRVFSAFQFSNINTLLTTLHWCCLPCCLRYMIWHIVITKDPAYVCRTNDTHLFPSFSDSLYFELLWPIFRKARTLCFMHWGKEKTINLRADVQYSHSWWDILPANTMMITDLDTVNVCFLTWQ